MNDAKKTKTQLINELTVLRQRNAHLEAAETERRQGQATLSTLTEHLASLLTFSPTVVYTCEPTGSFAVTFVSANIVSQFGYTVEECLADTQFWLTHIHPEDVARVLTRLSNISTLGHQVNEYRFLHKSGTYRWLRNECKMVCDTNHTPREIVGYWLDITEYKKLEEQLCQVQKIASVGTLAGSIAHEFNNMLAAIIGFTEMATHEISQANPAYHYLQEVLKAGLRAKDLVHQILTFSRKNDRKHKPVQLSLLVKETIKFLRASLPTTIDIQQLIPYDVGMVMADPTQMHQILINLCTNAVYAMRETGGLLEIGVDTLEGIDASVASHCKVRPGPYICLTVRDTGHGIAPEIAECIFEPFFTTKGVGEGTGMGLAIVKSIVTQHGGTITVESRPGAGTTFAIYLPRIDQIAERETQPEIPVMPYGQGRILFVDDEDAQVRLWQSMLARLGYEVLVSSSSSEALNIFQTAPYSFDLVITDQTMPQMTGEALAVELRRIRPDIPIVLCTGFSHSICAEKAQALGIDAFLMKPLRIQELGLAIRQALAQRATLATSVQ
jgi:PAS domain S-box-containing protein